MFNICRYCGEFRQCAPLRKHILRALSYSAACHYKLDWSDTVAAHVKLLVAKSKDYSNKVAEPERLTVKEMRKYKQEIGKLEPIVDLFTELKKVESEIAEMEDLFLTGDAELKEQVQEEVKEYEIKLDELQAQLIDAVVPKDEDESNNAVVEIRSGTGGQESTLFAAEIFAMYMKLASNQNWQFELISQSESATGGLLKATGCISGKNVFGMLKYESGVHRIQRVPVTETQGRIHTSTIAVSVLPQPTYTDFKLEMKDVKVDTYKGTGPGGQHVNTTDSSVRMTHIPTGVVVTAAGRSQLRNRETAQRLLSAQLYDRERVRRIKEHNDAKRSHLINLDRSQRIRTYNYPQDRITDHRVKESVSNIPDFLNGGTNFVELSNSLAMYERANTLATLDTSE